MIIVSSTYDLSAFPLMSEMQDIYKQIVHENNMKQLAECYYSYKMEAISKFNILEIKANISNFYIHTPLNHYFNDGKIYLHTPMNVNM